MAKKIGLQDYRAEDEQLINQLLEILQHNSVDYSIFFRTLCDFSEQNQRLRDQFLDRQAFDNWAKKYVLRLQQQSCSAQQRRENMQAVNPKYILRNYMAQTAIEKAYEGDYSEVNLLLEILQSPFAEHPHAEKYAGLPPDWAEMISVSCSS